MHPAIPRLIDPPRLSTTTSPAVRAELETFPKPHSEADLQLTNARAGVAAAKESASQHTERAKEV